MPRPLRVAAVVPYPIGWAAGQRFRIEQWLSALSPERLQVSYFPLFTERDYRRLYVAGARMEKGARALRALSKRLLQLESVCKHDVAVIYREAYPLGGPLLEQRIAERAPLIFDFDDAIWLGHTSESNRWIRRLKQPEKVATVARLSSVTTVGNEYLADYVSNHGGNARVLPTTIDVDLFRPSGTPRGHKPRRTVRIGWSGSPTTSGYLSQIAPVLRALLEREEVELWVVGDPAFSLPGAEKVTVLPWSRETEVEIVGSFDIGIMPLPDDQWTRGKCGFKALMYMSLGVATVASPVGVNRDIIDPGKNGLLASSDEEWLAALNELVDDASRRGDLGAAGRETVVDRYATHSWAKVFYEVLATAADGAFGRSSSVTQDPPAARPL